MMIEHESPFIFLGQERSECPASLVIGNRQYVRLGGDVYAPQEPTEEELVQLYAAWIERDVDDYDQHNSWAISIGYNSYELAQPYLNGLPIDVIDVACGTGLVSLGIKERATVGRHVGIDITPQMIRRALMKPELRDSLMVFHADIRSPGILPDESFDLAVGSLFINHLPRPEDARLAFENVAASLRPGGVFILVDTPRNARQDRYLPSLVTTFNHVEAIQMVHEKEADYRFPLDYYVARLL
ncbi:MAG: class I SAM-dependent methyltransferase [Candidatus Saccharimonadales bacterium]|nr:class I SAM-dependent methyltransferase [Candidatus Saccharimonadales bacterium]